MSKESWVYVIAPKTADGYGSPVKIGLSDNPAYRLMSLQGGSPVKLGIAYQFKFPRRDMALALEQAMLATHKDKRLHGEWLDMPADHAVIICAIGIRTMLEFSEVDEETLEACMVKTGARKALREGV